jgi:hypothetical protein
MGETHLIRNDQEALEIADRFARQIEAESAERDQSARFGRNARVHTFHDPVRWKYHAVGNFYLNDVDPPRHAWI